MKIALIAPTYLPARRANTFQVMKMAQALALTGQAVRVAVPGRPPVEDRRSGSCGEVDWQALAQHYGLQTFFPVEWLPAQARLRRYDFTLRALRWAKQQHSDLLYTRLPQAAALASLLGRPTVFELHDLPQGAAGERSFRLFLRGLGARRLVVISRALAADLADRFGAPADPPFTIVAPDGVDLARYSVLPAPEAARAALLPHLRLATVGETRAPGRWTPQTFTAGYTGHLYAGRGIEVLMGLAARLPEVLFLVVGGEPEEVGRRRVEADGLQLKNIIFTGFVANAELPAYQAACDVLLMPYQRQVAASSGGDIARYLSPLKLFEYLACGRAVLSSDLPVLREVLSPRNALLLPPDDLEAWATALQELRAQPARRADLAEQARRQAQHFTWEARARRIFSQIGSEPA
jgi:glycosyltransferase involved in cell wall biosynthesis